MVKNGITSSYVDYWDMGKFICDATKSNETYNIFFNAKSLIDAFFDDAIIYEVPAFQDSK